jgi:hypothetical protein
MFGIPVIDFQVHDISWFKLTPVHVSIVGDVVEWYEKFIQVYLITDIERCNIRSIKRLFPFFFRRVVPYLPFCFIQNW